MENEKKKVILSGIKPSGELTLGNYLGALKNWVKLQDDHETYFCIVDLHAITVRQEPKDLRRRTMQNLAIYIASGLDPTKNTFFIQSQVHTHAELAWILNCYSYMGEMSRMTQYKDKASEEGENITVGLFDYPVLMAADILLYQTDLVPVGKDQHQHLELARDIAIRFNNAYSPTFTVPQAFTSQASAKIMDLQNPLKKMDKSEENPNRVIYIMDPPNTIKKKIASAITDSVGVINYSDEQPGIKNLINIYSSITGNTSDEIVARYKGEGYARFKEELALIIIDELTPVQERVKDLLDNKKELENILSQGASKALYESKKTLNKVKKKIGFIIE
jgi:tryptophanyl-tRNA synthetase